MGVENDINGYINIYRTHLESLKDRCRIMIPLEFRHDYHEKTTIIGALWFSTIYIICEIDLIR